jgi:hypothetical protein
VGGIATIQPPLSTVLIVMCIVGKRGLLA